MNKYFSSLVLAFVVVPINPCFAEMRDLLSSLAIDSSVGKLPQSAVEPSRPDSAVKGTMAISGGMDRGKVPALIFDQAPPRAMGPGLHFDTQKVFYVYTDRSSSANHFAPSGWMGDYGDIELDDASTEDPADGKTCIKVTYLARGSQGNDWAGIYWQEPGGNWGEHPGGFHLKGMKQVTFWARGAAGGEEIANFKVGGLGGQYPDTGVSETGPVTLSTKWERFQIDLTDTDVSKISGGFAWAAGRFDNAGPITFYLDEIRYEK